MAKIKREKIRIDERVVENGVASRSGSFQQVWHVAVINLRYSVVPLREVQVYNVTKRPQ